MKEDWRKETKLELDDGNVMIIRSFEDNWSDLEIEINGTSAIVEADLLENIIYEHIGC